jgi:hypothetical protein
MALQVLMSVCMLNCSSLLNLAKVRLHGVEVDLSALACIRKQLRHVKMCKCLLMSSCLPAAETDPFASGWDKLEELNLSKSSIDTHILAVNMPSLKQLLLRGFSIKDDAGEALHGSMTAFALGCPRIIYVEFEPVLRLAPLPFKNFIALERLQLAFDPVDMMDLQRDAPVYRRRDLQLEVPSSLTALECTCIAKMDEWDQSLFSCISLDAALHVATACNGAGAPLRSLTLPHCTTAAPCFDPDNDMPPQFVEPEEGKAVQLYRPLATALHGLVHLDLSGSVDCSGHVVSELVSSIPSLRSLMLRFEDPGFAYTRPLVCSGLENLHVKYQVWRSESAGAAFAFTLVLVDTAALRSCTLEVLEEHHHDMQGDSISVELGCHEMADISWSAELINVAWHLGFEVHLPVCAEGLVQKQATLSYVFDKDEDDWSFAVKEE